MKEPDWWLYSKHNVSDRKRDIMMEIHIELHEHVHETQRSAELRVELAKLTSVPVRRETN